MLSLLFTPAACLLTLCCANHIRMWLHATLVNMKALVLLKWLKAAED